MPPDPPTPKPTPLSIAQPEWTLEFEILSTPKDIAGPSNLFLGINNYCPATGCSGDAFPPNPGILAYEVYLCHPQISDKTNCTDERRLTTSWVPPTEVQTWVLEAKYRGTMEQIEIAWHPQGLPDNLSLHIFPEGEEGDVIDMQLPSIPSRSYTINMGINVSNSFVICSRTVGIDLSRCFD